MEPEHHAGIRPAGWFGPVFRQCRLKTVGDFLLVNTGGGADQRLYEGSYDGLDARVAYEWTLDNGSTVSASVFGKNLTDEEWREQALFLGGPLTGFQGWGAPRTYAFELLVTL